MNRLLWILALALAGLTLAACSETPETIDHRFTFDLTPCWGDPKDDAEAFRVCSRASLETAVSKMGPNGCLIINQTGGTNPKLPVRFRKLKLSSEGLSRLDLRVDRETNVALFFFSEMVSTRTCTRLTVDSNCSDGCVVKLRDTLPAVPAGTTAGIDFKVLKDGKLTCSYEWGDTPTLERKDICDGVDNDCDGTIDETPVASGLGACCSSNDDCTQPSAVCVLNRCEICDPDTQTGCPDGVVCSVDGERPSCARCSTEDDCAGDSLCQDGKCVECLVESNQGCSGTTPICSLTAGKPKCVGCSDGECSDGLKCHMGSCVECIPEQPDCPHEAPVCDTTGEQPACRSCQNTDECPPQTLCFEGTCEECTPDDSSNCPAERPYCFASMNGSATTRYVCSGCANHEECQIREPTKPYCVAGGCHACDPSDATTCTSNSPICAQNEVTDYTCRSCVSNDECASSSPSRPVCSTIGATQGQCVVCEGNSGICPGDTYCINSQCSPCEPGTNSGCNAAGKPLCAERADRPGTYHCTPCNREAAPEASGCPANRVCALLIEGSDPVCELCDPFSGVGCRENGTVCARSDAGSYGCRPCNIDSTDCSKGQYSGRFCRLLNDLSRCLKCDTSAEPGVSNGCIDEDAPYCVDGECSPCDPVTYLGCDDGADTPPICARQDNGALCVGCTNDTQCVRKNGTYCDEVSGQCLACPENPMVGDMVPEGCPSPEPCQDGDCQDPTPICVSQYGACRACDPFSENTDRYTCDQTSDRPVCLDGNCAPCTSNEQCQLHPNARRYCREGLCQICDPATNGGCIGTSRPRCAADGSRCVQCRVDGDCDGGLSCNQESGFCGCNDDAQCIAISPDRPVCRPGANGVNECQPCSIDDDPRLLEPRNDCRDKAQCATSSRCQFCLDPTNDKQDLIKPNNQIENADMADRNPARDQQEDRQEGGYGCLETSDEPICFLGDCRPCRADAECARRPGDRNVCRSGRCELCREGDPNGCSVTVRAFATTEDVRASHRGARLEVTCEASGERIRLAGTGAPGMDPVTAELQCPSGSEISVCCSDGSSCDEPLPAVVAEDDWVIDRLQVLNLSPTSCAENEPAPPETNRLQCRGRIQELAIRIVCGWKIDVEE